MSVGAKVVIAEDHPLFRKALAEMVSEMPGIGQVYESGNGKEALQLVQQHNPKLAILDLNMPVMNGLQTLAELQQHYPDVQSIVLSQHADVGSVQLALQAGAKAYLPKDADLEEIETAVQAVLHNKTYLSSQLTQKLVISRFYHHPDQNLTVRERQVLTLMGQQQTTSQIADSLNLSIRTVERLRSAILRKTKSTTSAGAVLYAERNGLLTEM